MTCPEKLWLTCLACLLVSSTHLPLNAGDGFAACQYVPERKDDIAFENDKVAFRIYGPALKEAMENSGIDCWLKRVDYPIINAWYEGAREGRPYHKDHGEGYDPYHVGDSLGCGGLALWIDGRMRLSNVYRQYRILKNGPDEAVFEVEYIWDDLPQATREVRRFTLPAGSQLFRVDSQFFLDGKPAQVEVAIGVATHDRKALPYLDPEGRWVAAWETMHGQGLGTGVVLADASRARSLMVTSYEKDRSHILLVTPTDKEGRITYYGGFGWEKAGEITNTSEWRNYLSHFSKQLKN